MRERYLPVGVKENKNPDFYFRGRFVDGKSMLNSELTDIKKSKRNIQNRLSFSQSEDILIEIPLLYPKNIIDEAIIGQLNSSKNKHIVYVIYGEELFMYK